MWTWFDNINTSLTEDDNKYIQDKKCVEAVPSQLATSNLRIENFLEHRREICSLNSCCITQLRNLQISLTDFDLFRLQASVSMTRDPGH